MSNPRPYRFKVDNRTAQEAADDYVYSISPVDDPLRQELDALKARVAVLEEVLHKKQAHPDYEYKEIRAGQMPPLNWKLVDIGMDVHTWRRRKDASPQG